MRKKLFLIIIAASNCFCMELPPPTIILNAQQAALFTELAQQAQGILNNPAIDSDPRHFEIGDNEYEIYRQEALTPTSKRQRSECPICKKNVSDLAIHIRTHTREKPFKCKQCSASFADGSTFARHMLVHTGKKRFQCELCDSSFEAARSLTRHRRKEHGISGYISP